MYQKSKTLFEQAKNSIPGGVNSPVRAFKSVGGHPLFIAHAQGPYLYDIDGNRYLDMINSWGPMILGHAFTPVVEAVAAELNKSFSFGAPSAREVEMAELIKAIVPGIDKVRMVNSGTEATMSAIRLARGYTEKNKIIKFEGCYHGHGDSFLIAAGSGAMTFGVPDSPGVPKGVAEDTLTAPYNDLPQVERLIAENKDQVAAIILEPVVGNMGCVLPNEGFLKGLRTICDQHQILLIFDEVMTGFRLALGGAQERFGIEADISTFGKIIGGGLPVGAYAAKAAIMDYVSPAGPVYQAGTLSGNPLAMTAGYTMLNYLNQHPEVYQTIEHTTKRLVDGIRSINSTFDKNYTINSCGSMFCMFFTEIPVNNLIDAKTSDTVLFGKYFHAMLKRGIYLPPSQFETMFVSAAITEIEIEQYLSAHKAALTEVLNG